MNLTLTSAYVLAALMALTTPSWAVSSVASRDNQTAVTANAAGTSDGAGDNSNPYAIIVDRNIFRLNPLPPPPPPMEKPPEVPKVYLNGMMKHGGHIRVLLSIPAKDAKSQPAYFSLAPNEKATGEKDDVLELVSIHPDQQEVDVVINGTKETLSVISNSMASAGAKAGGAPAAPAPPAAAAPGGSAVVVAGETRSSSPYGGVTVGGGGGGGVTVIGGNNTSPAPSVGNSGATGGVAVGGGSYAAGNGVGSQLANALLSGPNQGQIGSTQTEAPVSREVQAVGMLSDAQQNPNGPPLPPELASMLGQDTGPVPTPKRGGGGAPPPVP